MSINFIAILVILIRNVGGINDIDKHVNSPKHNENANTIRSKLEQYITKCP